MKIDVLNTKGETIEQLTLSDDVFGIEPNENVLAQYLRVYQANQRQGTVSTKDKSEVSGGGKKPWKQKGTGRARVGSNRSPLWRHGGVTHGPKPKDWSLDINKKVKRLAILSALSQKFLNKEVVILDKLEFAEPKTKEMLKVLENIKVTGKSLLVTNTKNMNVLKSGSNIKSLSMASANILNVFDILNTRKLIFVKDAVLELEKKYTSKKVAKEVTDENK